MKLLDVIEEKQRGRVAQTRTVADYTALSPKEATANLPPDHWEWTFVARVGCIQTGPEEAREHLAKRARRLIAREVFGELEDDIQAVLELLWEENHYREPGDPVLSYLESMLRKVRGDQH